MMLVSILWLHSYGTAVKPQHAVWVGSKLAYYDSETCTAVLSRQGECKKVFGVLAGQDSDLSKKASTAAHFRTQHV